MIYLIAFILFVLNIIAIYRFHTEREQKEHYAERLDFVTRRAADAKTWCGHEFPHVADAALFISAYDGLPAIQQEAKKRGNHRGGVDQFRDYLRLKRRLESSE